MALALLVYDSGYFLIILKLTSVQYLTPVYVDDLLNDCLLRVGCAALCPFMCDRRADIGADKRVQ